MIKLFLMSYILFKIYCTILKCSTAFAYFQTITIDQQCKQTRDRCTTVSATDKR